MMCLRASTSRKKFITFSLFFYMGRISLAIEFGSDEMTHDTVLSHLLLKLRDNKLFRLFENCLACMGTRVSLYLHHQPSS